MDYFIRFANWHWIYLLLPALIGFVVYRLFVYKSLVVKHSLVGFLSAKGAASPAYKRNILFALQLIILALLSLLCLKPQKVDKDSQISVEGIDIVLDLDVSGSMRFFDELDNPKSRIDVAKDEAIKFIEKRDNDQIGVVIFGAHVVTLCPLTLDKNILNRLIGELKLGFINADGTSLGTSLVAACNRLKNSKAKSKVVILLTDGEPSPGDLPPKVGIEMAKKLGIKVYTVGIGAEQGGYEQSVFGMSVRNPHAKINKKLLENIAAETGAKFFMARNEKEMGQIYQTIDQLEKTEHEATIYANYYDLFFPIAMTILVLLLLYILLSIFIWFGV